MKIPVLLLVILAAGPARAAETPVNPKDAPFPVPPGAQVTVESKKSDNQDVLVYTVSQQAPPKHEAKGPAFTPGDFNRNFNVGRELAKCQQRQTSRRDWKPDEPNNFTQINGRCAEHTFADPVDPEPGLLPCQVDARRSGQVSVVNCVVDGVRVIAFMFTTDCCPSSRTMYAIKKR